MLSSRSGIWEVGSAGARHVWLLTTFSQSHILHHIKVPCSCAIVNKQALKAHTGRTSAAFENIFILSLCHKNRMEMR
jgi:hypothetical protein